MMGAVSEHKFHDFIYLAYKDDDGLPLDDELGEVFWSPGQAGAYCVNEKALNYD